MIEGPDQYQRLCNIVIRQTACLCDDTLLNRNSSSHFPSIHWAQAVYSIVRDKPCLLWFENKQTSM